MAIDHLWATFRNAAKARYIGFVNSRVFKNAAIGFFFFFIFFLAKSVIPAQIIYAMFPTNNYLQALNKKYT